MSFNSPEDPSNVVVENEKLHLSSLLVLFENLGCLQKHDNQYILANRPTQAEWESCMNFAASVEILKLDSHGVEEAHKISSGTYIRLIQQLKGRPLFPQLKRLYIENYHGLVDYFSLFLSSNLQTIQLFNTQPPEKPGAISPVVLESLLCDFSEWSPGVQLLRITQDTTMPISLLDSISLLSNLRTLDLALVQVGSFEEFRPLAPLVLESFTLKLSCSSYTRLPNPITPLPDFLASLERLHISGPLIAVSDFVRSLGSQHLTSLVVRDEDIFSPRWDQHRKGKKSSTLTEAEGVKHQMYDFGSMVHTISLRWGHFLRTVTIASSCNARVDFAQLSGMPLLEKLCIFDCPVDGLEHTLKPSAVWYYLDTLHLTDNHISSSLPDSSFCASLEEAWHFHRYKRSTSYGKSTDSCSSPQSIENS